MTGPFIRLTRHDSGRAVYLNAANVTYIDESLGDDDKAVVRTVVHLTGGDVVRVREPAGEVMDTIDTLIAAEAPQGSMAATA
ncbi:MAG: hypothetical protein IT305_16710 [Chloroflexi bacterium]|nr:hypothetical protein [Chloroflexota bacterium]